MIKTLIIDDEKNAQQAISGLLNLYCPTIKIVGTASSVQEGVRLLEQLQPELIFLDVHLGEETGFTLLEQLHDIDFQLIFLTGHSDYAIQAFRHNAVDYLLKPIDPALLVKAIEKVKDRRASFDLNKITRVLGAVEQQQTGKITIATAGGYHIIEIDQIIRIEGDGNYSTIYLRDKRKVVSSKKLKHYAQQLPLSQFVLTHQSHLVRISAVCQWLNEDGGFLLLNDGSQIPLARRRREAVKQALQIGDN